MRRKLLAIFTSLICLCFSAKANQEITVVIDNLNNTVVSEPLEGFGTITFEYVGKIGNFGRVKVRIENLTMNPPMAILAFNTEYSEKLLKKGKPKIEFEKKYPGEKGKRTINFYSEISEKKLVIPAAESEEILNLDVPLSGGASFTLPLYLAKYKPKDLIKKGEFNTKFTILEEYIYAIRIKVKAWSEDDATYMEVKKGVADLISSLKNVTFCPNKKHRPSLFDQQLPYQQKIDSLDKVIKGILNENKDWTAEDAPYKAYSELYTELTRIDLNSYLKNCPKHRGGGHKCNYCTLRVRQLYHKIDDLYQQLHAGRISKEKALQTANAINNCFQQNKSRKKDDFYGNKISGFYSRIANY